MICYVSQSILIHMKHVRSASISTDGVIYQHRMIEKLLILFDIGLAEYPLSFFIYDMQFYFC